MAPPRPAGNQAGARKNDLLTNTRITVRVWWAVGSSVSLIKQCTGVARDINITAS